MSDQPLDPLRQFIIDAHFNLAGVQDTLELHPDWLDVEYDWGEDNGTETPLGAAAHVGNAAIARYLLNEGATITPAAAAMLGDRAALDALIDLDPANANAHGAHGIPLLAHAVFSGSADLLDHLVSRGMRLDGVSSALLNAVSAGQVETARWALAHGADPTAKNYQGLTAAEIARESGHPELMELLG